MKALIVDTDTIIDKALTELLIKRSIQSKTVTSAQRALDELDYYKPDIVILEPQLGPHNGIEFIYEMRSHADVNHVRLYVYSSNRNILDERYEASWRLARATVFYKPTTSPKQLVMAITKELQ